MNNIRLEIYGLSQSKDNIYILVLSEKVDSQRKIPIYIGHVEAQTIAIQLEKMTLIRPMMHNVFYDTCTLYGIILKEVNIVKIFEGIYYSELVFDKSGDELRIDSRTSDAVTLAICFNVPIYTNEEVINYLQVDVANMNDLTKLTEEQLQILMDEAISEEDFENAAKIRDEIKKRN